MKRKDIISALAARLRRQGITASPADLAAFAADLPQAPAPDGDIDALLRRFSERQIATLERRRIRAWVEGIWIALTGAWLLTWAATSCIIVALNAAIEPPVGIVAGLALGVIGFGIAVAMIFAGLGAASRQSREIRRQIDSLRRDPSVIASAPTHQ